MSDQERTEKIMKHLKIARAEAVRLHPELARADEKKKPERRALTARENKFYRLYTRTRRVKYPLLDGKRGTYYVQLQVEHQYFCVGRNMTRELAEWSRYYLAIALARMKS